MTELLLGVNIDHIATLRNARAVGYPDPVQAAFIAEQAGADAITVHLREDRRHMTDRDVQLLRQTLQTRMNLELAPTEEMLALAERIKPQACCLVPERRQELTTECGLDVMNQLSTVKTAVARLTAVGIAVALFIDPERAQVDAAVASGAKVIELHTGAYAQANNSAERLAALQTIAAVANYAARCKLQVNAGHGLHYHNVQPIAALPSLQELNIGHAIVARAVMQGLAAAVAQMKQLMLAARAQSQ